MLRIRDVNPESRILICFHPGSWIQEEHKYGENFCLVYLFFCHYKFHKKLYTFFKNESQLTQRIWVFYPKEVLLISQKYWFGFRDPEKTHPGSWGVKAPDAGSAALTPEQNCQFDPSGLWIRPKKIVLLHIKLWYFFKKKSKHILQDRLQPKWYKINIPGFLHIFILPLIVLLLCKTTNFLYFDFWLFFQAGMIPQTIRQIFKETSRLHEKGWTYSLQVTTFLCSRMTL
jgi:hypothetical protein